MYLTLNPPPRTTPHDPDPLILLHRILALHLPEDLAQSLPAVSVARETPRWLRWEADKGVEATLKKSLSRCIGEGIWGFVWQYGHVGEPKVGSDEDEEMEDEELESGMYTGSRGGRDSKRVSQRGWELLAWFCDLWEKDRASQGGDNQSELSCRIAGLLAILIKSYDSTYLTYLSGANTSAIRFIHLEAFGCSETSHDGICRVGWDE
jgi:hypothetical protein